jgi:peptide/nickel transport system substrate-binding protein
MKRFSRLCLAVASAWLCAPGADAARPRYGGTLRIDTTASVASLTAASFPGDATGADQLRPLIFETLVTAGRDGRIRPGLATSWQPDARSTRWTFNLRADVDLHDGSRLTARDVASALAEPAAWRATAGVNSITLESDRPLPDLLWELADPRHGIAVARGDTVVGSGPFAVDRVQPRLLTLRAHERHWAGRPFVDRVHVEAGRPLSAQLPDVESGRVDIAGAGTQDARRIAQRGLTLAASRPDELVALAIQPGASGAVADERARRALSLAIDRGAMAGVLVQGLGVPAAALLPQWLTGYTALFQSAHDREAARALAATLPADRRRLTLRFEATDPLSRSLAERVVVDARDAGLTIVLDPSQPPSLRPIDLRLVRIRFSTLVADRAASMIMPSVHPQLRTLVPPAPAFDAALETVYQFERTVIDRLVMVPLLHLPDVYAVGPNVETDGRSIVGFSSALDLANVWLREPPR